MEGKRETGRGLWPGSNGTLLVGMARRPEGVQKPSLVGGWVWFGIRRGEVLGSGLGMGEGWEWGMTGSDGPQMHVGWGYEGDGPRV